MSKSWRSLFSGIVCAGLLAACGGGGSGSTATSTSTPAAPATYVVAGNVTGSSSPGLMLELNGASPIPVSNSGGFAWPGILTNGQTYSVTVSSQPTGATCTVTNGTGTINGASVSNIVVSCGPTLAVLAGNMGGAGYIDGSTASARFDAPNGIGKDSAGNIYVLDYSNHAIRKIAAGEVTTIANVSAISLSASPGSMAVDGSGNVFVSTLNDCNTYKINSTGITLVANAGCLQGSIALDSAGNLYSLSNFFITKVSPGGVVTTIAETSGATLSGGLPYGWITYMKFLAVDSANNIYGAGNGLIQKLTPGGALTTVAGNFDATVSADGSGTAATFANLNGIAVDGNDTLYVTDGSTVRTITAAGVVKTLAGVAGSTGSVDGVGAAARFSAPAGITVDGQGNIYVADAGNHNIREITAAGAVTTVSGIAPVVGSSDGLGTASFNNPQGIVTDNTGNIFVVDNGNFTIRKITSSGLTSTFAGSPGLPGDANGSGAAARFGKWGPGSSSPYGTYNYGPMQLAIDSADNVYVADPGNLNIREISPTGMVATFAGPGAAGSFGAAIFYIYPFDYLCHAYGGGFNCSTGGPFGPAVGPYGVAVNSMGNIYVADTAAGTMSTITPAGVVTTLGGAISPDSTFYAGPFERPNAVVADNAGNAYITSVNSILKVTPAGVVSTLAGSGVPGSADGIGAAASFSGPTGITMDGSGNFYVADTLNCTIRKITPAAVVSTVVGVAGQCGFAAGPLPASLGYPNYLALSGRTLYITTSNGIAVVNSLP